MAHGYLPGTHPHQPIMNLVTEDVLRKLNENYGSQLSTLDGCLRLKEQFDCETKTITDELDLSNEHATVAITLRNAADHCKIIAKTLSDGESYLEEVRVHLEEVDKVKAELEAYFEQLNALECTAQYLKVIQSVEDLCDQLEVHLKSNDDEQCTTVFANITEIARHLADTPAIHLRSYIKAKVDYWFGILRDKLSQDLDHVLQAIHWPFVNANLSIEAPGEGSLKKLQLIVEYLLQIDLPEELVTPLHPHGLLSNFLPPSLPIELMIVPLKKRFLFHFYGSRKTNRIDKPEWYFTKILSWIRDHSGFVDKWLQPVVDKMGLYHIEVKTELMRGLVQMAVEKLYSDLPALQYDDFAFSHCIDEALGFDKELKMNYEYPQSQPSILIVLTQAQVFIKWMAMEKKYALEKMDAMLSDLLQTEIVMEPSEIEEFKIMPFAEIFITLLQTITERYEGLPQPGHRLQFLELQLELLDDFRVRLLQLGNAENDEGIDSKITIIANTTHYIENVLIDWGQMLHFLNLYYYKNQSEITKTENLLSSELDNSLTDVDTDTVFVEILSLYRHMKKDLLYALVDSTVLKARYCSKNYRRENWAHMTIMKDMRSYSLTPSACPMFEVLGTKLHQFQKYLTDKLFTIVWRLVAQKIDTFLYEKLVLANTFNEGGAKQLKFDIMRNLLPLFAQYTDKPDSYCTHLNEACILLNVTQGSALLLKEMLTVLEGATGVEDKRGQALKEIGVCTFGPHESLKVLGQRTDIGVRRVSSID